jgi:hypothetical protein
MTNKQYMFFIERAHFQLLMFDFYQFLRERCRQLNGKGQNSRQWKSKNKPPSHEKLVASQRQKNRRHTSNREKLAANKFF